MAQFTKFCNDNYHLHSRARRLTDFRKRPEIPMSRIFLLMLGSLALGKKSFHQIDLFARQPQAGRWLGSDRRMVASDATLWRVLPGLNRNEVRRELHQANLLLREQGHGFIELPGGRRIRAAAIDGTVQGGRYACALEMLGEHAAILDFEPSRGPGHELTTSYALLRRAAKAYKERFFEIVLGDGLYVNRDFFRICREELGRHALVKCKGSESNRLLIFQDAETLFDSGSSSSIEFAKGTDAGRAMAYELHASRGFHHDGYDGELKVARMKIRMLQGSRKGQVETSWIVTTDLTLTAAQMRELAHRRWSIENDAFRAMNAHMGTKHVWTRGESSEATYEVLMLLMALAFTLLLAFRAQLDRDFLWSRFHLRSVTLAYLAEGLILSLDQAAGAFPPDG